MRHGCIQDCLGKTARCRDTFCVIRARFFAHTAPVRSVYIKPRYTCIVTRGCLCEMSGSFGHRFGTPIRVIEHTAKRCPRTCASDIELVAAATYIGPPFSITPPSPGILDIAVVCSRRGCTHQRERCSSFRLK